MLESIVMPPGNLSNNNSKSPPTISVVCGVYNGGDILQESLLSVLQQNHNSFEFIVVDDGSNDGSTKTIQTLATRFDTLKPIYLSNNQGLTHALKIGCAEARGQYISRHDVGDFSLPDKLTKLQMVFTATPTDNVVLACCGTRYQGPNQEFIEEVIPSQTLLDTIHNDEPDSIFGASHHGATMFTKAAYLAVGGYRAAFPVAQDIDLWIRLAETGAYRPCPEVLYVATIAANSLSRQHADTQRQARRLAVTAGQLRRAGAPDGDASITQLAEQQLRKTQQPVSAQENAAGWYFVGCVIRAQNPAAAVQHFWRAVTIHPLHVKAWFRLITSGIGAFFSRDKSKSSTTSTT